MSVHSTHCCKDHGCKYNEPLCPVVSGQEQQASPCEDCGDKSLFNRLQQAHRAGWEQCQREAQQALCEICCYNSADNPVPDECTTCNKRRAIASMEYKGEAKNGRTKERS